MNLIRSKTAWWGRYEIMASMMQFYVLGSTSVYTKGHFTMESLPFNDDTRIDQFMLEKMYVLVVRNYKTSYVLIYFLIKI